MTPIQEISDLALMQRAGLLHGVPTRVPDLSAAAPSSPLPGSRLLGHRLRWAARAGQLDLYSSRPERLTRLGPVQIRALEAGLRCTGFTLHTPVFTLDMVNLLARTSGPNTITLTCWDSAPEDPSNFGGSVLSFWRDLGAHDLRALQRLALHMTRRHDVYQPYTPAPGERGPVQAGTLVNVGFLEADPGDLHDLYRRGQHGLAIGDEPENDAPDWDARSGCGGSGRAVSLSPGDEVITPDGQRLRLLGNGWADLGPDTGSSA